MPPIAALLTVTILLASHQQPQPEVIRLWEGKAPGAVGDDPEKDVPTLTLHRPAADKANGCAVVVCPGGGYGHLAVGHEGQEIADWLNERGVAAFVLRYRIAPRYREPVPMLDVQRAVRLVRARAKDFSTDPKRVGVWGFSAGGHLASTAGTHFDTGDPRAQDPIDRASCRPDFLILAYPVISMEPPVTHAGSRRNLLGEDPSPEKVAFYNNHQRVTKDTPPTFLFHTDADRVVPAENSVLFYLALRKAGVPAELHIYETGRHGVGLAAKDPALSGWPERLAGWMKGRGLLKAAR
ncbi:MAG TPA: alpha/beta hydrolase [Gemmataceae bacterium]